MGDVPDDDQKHINRGTDFTHFTGDDCPFQELDLTTRPTPKDPQAELDKIFTKYSVSIYSDLIRSKTGAEPMTKMKHEILAIFQAHQQELLSEARLSERAWAYKNMRDHGTDPQWIEIARLRMERLINAGKLDNSNPPIQKLDKSVQNKTNDGGSYGDSNITAH